MNQEVTDFIQALNQKPNQEWQVAVCEQLRKVIFEALPTVEERIQYGKPHFLLNGKYACVIHPFKDTVAGMIFNATHLEAPQGFFEKTDKPERKTIKIKKDQKVDYALFGSLLKQAASSL